MTNSAALTTTETNRLAELEETIERGLETFLEVGNALLEIRESKLYRQTHKTFAAYTKARWGFTARRARQLVQAAQTGTMVPVENERQARELGGLDQGAIKTIWLEAEKIAEANESKVTATIIKEARRLTIWDRQEGAFRMKFSPPGYWRGPAKPIPPARIPAALAAHDRIKAESDAIRKAAGLKPLPDSGTVTAWREKLDGNGNGSSAAAPQHPDIDKVHRGHQALSRKRRPGLRRVRRTDHCA